jgi:predicted transglutaminase-like cysteine proteinase
MKTTIVSMLLAIGLQTVAFAGEHIIPSTPFDHKLDHSGLFQAFRAESIGTASMDQLNVEFATARSFRYISDQDDYWQSAEETSQRHAGDCEDKAIWLFERLTKAGFSDLRLVIGKYRVIDKELHVWITYTDNGTTYLLDPSSQKKIWKSSDFSSEWYKPVYSFDGHNRYSYTSR